MNPPLPRSLVAVLLIGVTAPWSSFAHPNHAIAPFPPSPLRSVAARPAAATAALKADARLSVEITDAKTRAPTAARVRITDPNGKPLGLPISAAIPVNDETRLAAPGSVVGLPAEAIGVMYGQNDAAQGFAFQPDGSFYVKGRFELPMPAGRFFLTISKGYEFARDQQELVFKPGDHLTRSVALRRWVDMPARGWYSADDHIHLRRSPRENPLILDWIAAEDVHVGVLLQMGDFWTTYFSQYGFGRRGRFAHDDFLLTSGQEEPRTAELGHTISLGAESFVRLRDDYYAYDKFFDRIHALGGVSGYAHQAMSFHGYRGMTLDVLGGKIDFLELLQFCVPEGPLAVEHYYRFLDLGYKVTALAGSDFPWCGRGRHPGEEQVGAQIGNARFYTYTGNPFSFERWLAAVKAGNTFVTSGPMLELKVNGQLPGSAIDIAPGTKLRISASAHGHATQIPLQRLQIVAHGKVIAEAQAKPGATSAELTLDHELAPVHGLWIAARVDAGPSQLAHTTPVYVTVNRDGFHNRDNLAAQVAVARRHLDEIRALLNQPAPNEPASPRAIPGPLSYRGGKAWLEQRIATAERSLDELSRRR